MFKCQLDFSPYFYIQTKAGITYCYPATAAVLCCDVLTSSSSVGGR